MKYFFNISTGSFLALIMSFAASGAAITSLSDPQRSNNQIYYATFTTTVVLPHSDQVIPAGVSTILVCKYPTGTSRGCIGDGWVSSYVASGDAIKTFLRVTPGEPLDRALQRWISQNGNPVTTRQRVFVGRRETYNEVCYGLMYASNNNKVISAVPGATCGKAPPIGNRCDFNLDSSYFDFTGTPQNLNSLYKEKVVDITCSVNSTISIRATSSAVRLDDNLLGNIYINGVALINSRVLNVPSNGAKITVGVKLSGSAEAGKYNGSEILIIDIQ